ncbi:hypothetical protein IFR05_015111 [Cadophora sp. M221]|nr:hypothetical protein IFR05_015111 [Cadophora sp. M221]
MRQKTNPRSSKPFEMVEVMPHVFMSSWPPYIPDKITHTLNVTPKASTQRCKNGTWTTHKTMPIDPDGELFDMLHLLISFIIKTVEESCEPSPVTNILIYSEYGQNHAALAVLAYLCAVLRINVVDAFFMLREKKKGISPSDKLMQQIQDYMQAAMDNQSPPFKECGNVSREILRRILKEKGLHAMKKAETEDWMYEAGHY